MTKRETIIKNCSATTSYFSTHFQIVFIVLKLCNVIHWSWLWVLAPLWIGIIIIFLLLIGSIVVALTKTYTLDEIDRLCGTTMNENILK